MEQILGAVSADKSFRGGLPRLGMLLCFLIVGEQEERIDPFRRRLPRCSIRKLGSTERRLAPELGGIA
jgi:hypothetical protein